MKEKEIEFIGMLELERIVNIQGEQIKNLAGTIYAMNERLRVVEIKGRPS